MSLYDELRLEAVTHAVIWLLTYLEGRETDPENNGQLESLRDLLKEARDLGKTKTGGQRRAWRLYRTRRTP